MLCILERIISFLVHATQILIIPLQGRRTMGSLSRGIKIPHNYICKLLLNGFYSIENPGGDTDRQKQQRVGILADS